MMEPIGAYRTTEGWAAYDKRGLAWRVSEAEADLIRAKAKPEAC